MQVSVADAIGRLADLIRLAETGEEVILTRDGRAVVRLVPLAITRGKEARRSLLRDVRAACANKATAGPSAARSQDFLYGTDVS